jgi:hypothetical protein
MQRVAAQLRYLPRSTYGRQTTEAIASFVALGKIIYFHVSLYMKAR